MNEQTDNKTVEIVEHAITPRPLDRLVMSAFSVLSIPTRQAESWLLKKHYAHRLCPVSYAYGVYRGTELIGVVTYGTPVSSPLRAGICGPEWKDRVIELNRLCCENTVNVASFLVGRSLSMLPKPSIVVSFADTEQGHIGYVYQATNFIYTGLTAKRTDWKIRGREHLHGATVADMSRGQKDRAAFMRDKFGDDFYLKDRPRKHRYIFFCGSKKERKEMVKCLRYSIEAYPKGESKRYDAEAIVPRQDVLFTT